MAVFLNRIILSCFTGAEWRVKWRIVEDVLVGTTWASRWHCRCATVKENRGGGGKRRRASSSSSSSRTEQSNSSITDDGTRHEGRQLTGEWSRASRSSLVRPAFPRLASPLLRRLFFPRTLANGGLSSPSRYHGPRIYTWRLRRDSMRRLMSPTGSRCQHPRADLSARKMFLIRGGEKKKNTRATNSSLSGGESHATFFLVNCRAPFLFFVSRGCSREPLDEHVKCAAASSELFTEINNRISQVIVWACCAKRKIISRLDCEKTNWH